MATSITLTRLTPSDNASLMPSSGPLRTIAPPGAVPEVTPTPPNVESAKKPRKRKRDEPVGSIMAFVRAH
eukprot:977582-Prymnesium_polylepis.1